MAPAVSLLLIEFLLAYSSIRHTGRSTRICIQQPSDIRRSVLPGIGRRTKGSIAGLDGRSSGGVIRTSSRLSLREYTNDSEIATLSTKPSAWCTLATRIGECLLASDRKRDSGFDGSSTGWTSWVDDASALRLQRCLDDLYFVADSMNETAQVFDEMQEVEDTVRWFKWMKSSPVPVVVECSESLRASVLGTINSEELDAVTQTAEEFGDRIACRMIILPSGSSLAQNLRTVAGAMVYGKLLYGGVTRYRRLGSGASATRRKAGERTVIVHRDIGTSNPAHSTSWLQYGGPERNYDAVDMGPCALLEITLLPKGLTTPLMREESDFADTSTDESNDLDMSLIQTVLNHQNLFAENPPQQSSKETKVEEEEGQQKQTFQSQEIESSFQSKLGGLNHQIDAIVRRVLNGRSLIASNSKSDSQLLSKIPEQQFLKDLGLEPIKGLLLYGPPGCGKTALAREISRLLTERQPKIISAPELLDRWVGGSERLVRDLFGDAEEELQLCGGDYTMSGLHVIVIDEIDAVFRKRSSAEDSGEVTRASSVNQILAKLDGVNALQNILLIGTTNRIELLDEALLRPGRLEVQVAVPLPDLQGRREILKIHFAALRERGRLSRPLCQAIDGYSSKDQGDTESRSSGFRSSLQRALEIGSPSHIGDLADSRWTGGFSGADLEGLVRNAGSLALSRSRRDGSGVGGLLITLEDVGRALIEVRK